FRNLDAHHAQLEQGGEQGGLDLRVAIHLSDQRRDALPSKTEYGIAKQKLLFVELGEGAHVRHERHGRTAREALQWPAPGRHDAPLARIPAEKPLAPHDAGSRERPPSERWVETHPPRRLFASSGGQRVGTRGKGAP